MTKQELCDSFYRMNNVVTIDITMPQADWDALKNARPEPEPWPHGQLCIFDFTGDRYAWFTATSVKVSGTVFPDGGAHSFDDVGIRKRSFCGSFSTTKPALALDFSRDNAANEDVIEDLIGTKYITLNNSVQDPSFIRQALGFELFRQAGLPFSRCNFAHVKVNDTHIGFYVNVEPIKKRHIKHNFNDNDAGNLYEIERDEDFTEEMIDRISFEGFSGIENKEDLKRATEILANGDPAVLGDVIDVPQFLRYFAMEVLLKHHDGYTRNLNNTYIYNDVAAVADPDIDNINFKFIPWGLDQILKESSTFRLQRVSVPGKLVIDDDSDDGLFQRLRDEIRDYATGIFDRGNYNNVLLPFISQMEEILRSEVEEDLTAPINTVRRQLKLVKSGAFQLLKEFPGNSFHLLDKDVDEDNNYKCAHASNSERVSEHYESYHRVQPQEERKSDRWYIAYDEEASAYTIRNRKHETYLHASDSKYTDKGHLRIYCYVDHPHEGNYFNIELVPNPDRSGMTGYFKISSTRTGNYLHFSNTDLTPLGRKRIYQSAANATILYLF